MKNAMDNKETFAIRPIARYEGDLPDKFGLPRQAGLVEALEGRVVFLPPYRREEALRGLEGFSHIWLIWQFDRALREDWSPTVRPPRLGGNRRLGVFATRSPFRPNGLGLSCVRLLGLERDGERGTVLRVAGADLADGTPIFDVKPYLPYADAHPEALSGFAPEPGAALGVRYAPGTAERLPADKRAALTGILANDPRPRYQQDAARVYALSFAGCTVRFSVDGDTLTVTAIETP